MTMIADARRPEAYELPRECVDSYGNAKVGFPTRRMAQHVRRVKGVLDQRVYRCGSCGMVHLGHRRAR